MLIRPISAADIEAVLGLLREGFPARPPSYWRNALDHLARRPEVAGFPKYGFLLDVGGVAEGVILLLTADRGNGGARSNLSSWYVRPAHRKYASFLFQRALKDKKSTYLNLSPSPNVLPIAAAFGFKPYTGGAVLLDPRNVLAAGGPVHPYDPRTGSGLESDLRACAEAHLAYGCTALVVDDADGKMLALYRVKYLKRLIPAARFVYGRPERLLRNAGSLMRSLISRGLPVALIDAPLSLHPPVGRLFAGRDIRYVKGGAAPEPGDLLETEIAVFGP
jgi:hypothetical protein